MTKTLLILGATGMLGSVVGKWFAEQSGYDVWFTGRNPDLTYGRKDRWIKFDPTGKTLDAATTLGEAFLQMPSNPDYVLNCLGVIKPKIEKSPYESILINSLLPHEWALYCKSVGVKLVHITTDCVWSGRKGNYVEGDAHDALDSYGKTKSLGEPGNCMVLRTSIIGPEIGGFYSLVAWAQSQKGKKVRGFTDHFWSGVTTKQYAQVCQQIIEGGLYEEGTSHVFSNKVSKRELLKLLSDRYELGLEIEPALGPEPCDRSLYTTKDLMKKLKIAPLHQQIAEM